MMIIIVLTRNYIIPVTIIFTLRLNNQKCYVCMSYFIYYNIAYGMKLITKTFIYIAETLIYVQKKDPITRILTPVFYYKMIVSYFRLAQN